MQRAYVVAGAVARDSAAAQRHGRENIRRDPRGALRRRRVHQYSEGRHAQAVFPNTRIVIGVDHRCVAQPAKAKYGLAGIHGGGKIRHKINGKNRR